MEPLAEQTNPPIKPVAVIPALRTRRIPVSADASHVQLILVNGRKVEQHEPAGFDVDPRATIESCVTQKYLPVGVGSIDDVVVPLKPPKNLGISVRIHRVVELDESVEQSRYSFIGGKEEPKLAPSHQS
jgi:hypothetical protein